MRCGVPKNGERHIDTFTLTNRVSGSRNTTHAFTSRAYVAVGVKDRNTNLISRLISHCPHRFILPSHSDTEYHQYFQLGPSHLRFINPPAVRKHPIEQLAFYTSMHVCDGMSIEARCACNPQLFDATQRAAVPTMSRYHTRFTKSSPLPPHPSSSGNHFPIHLSSTFGPTGLTKYSSDPALSASLRSASES
jgi:hypothetical protein